MSQDWTRFGELLQGHINRLGITVDRFAHQINTDPFDVGQWLRGERVPERDIVLQCQLVLQVTDGAIDKLLNAAGYPGQVSIYLSSDVALLAGQRERPTIEVLADLLRIAPHSLGLRTIPPGDTDFNLRVPPDAADRFLYWLHANTEVLHRLEIREIILERSSGKTERWVVRSGKFKQLKPERGATRKRLRIDTSLRVWIGTILALLTLGASVYWLIVSSPESRPEPATAIIAAVLVLLQAIPNIEAKHCWDVFVCHASEDRGPFVRDLVKSLENLKLRVWFDEFILKIGYEVHRSIELGLLGSRFVVVVLSPHFFHKEEAQRELDWLLERRERKCILPVWHQVSDSEVRQYRRDLLGLQAVSSSKGHEAVAAGLFERMHDERTALERFWLMLRGWRILLLIATIVLLVVVGVGVLWRTQEWSFPFRSTPTATPTPSSTLTSTATAKPTATQTATWTPTATGPATWTPTATKNPTLTPTATRSATATETATLTPTVPVTPTPRPQTPAFTPTATIAPTVTPTATSKPTPPPPTPKPTPTWTRPPVPTATWTRPVVPTATRTP